MTGARYPHSLNLSEPPYKMGVMRVPTSEGIRERPGGIVLDGESLPTGPV